MLHRLPDRASELSFRAESHGRKSPLINEVVAPARVHWDNGPWANSSENGICRKFDVRSSQDCKGTERVMAQCPSSHVAAI